MTGIQAPGVGSGLDVASLVSQLVAAERAPLDARVTRAETAATVKISALASLKGAAGVLRDALAGIRDASSLALRIATSANREVFTASATSAVPPGTYDVEVERLATAHKLASEWFVEGRNAVVGTGTLQMTVGDVSFDVVIADSNKTLAGIRDAINQASGNTVVSATIVNETGGSRLVLTARETGVEHSISVTQTGGDGGLAQLVYDPDNLPGSTLASTAAVNARVLINGYAHESASNTVTGAIEGLTLNLLKADDGNEHGLTIAEDTVQTAVKVKKFVQDYNALATLFSNLQAYNATTKKAGAMLGDAFVRGLEAQLRRGVFDTVTGASGDFGSLAAIGIRTDSRGQLTVDETKLNAALAGDYEGVASLFTATDGVAVRLYAQLDAALDDESTLGVRSAALNAEIKRLDKEKDAIDARMTSVEARYRAQFTALDTLLAQLNSTSTYLANALSSNSWKGG